MNRFIEAQAVYLWQGDPHVHPLTCGNDSDHELTYDLIFHKGLSCPKCGWQQETVPEVVIDRLIDVVGVVKESDLSRSRPVDNS